MLSIGVLSCGRPGAGRTRARPLSVSGGSVYLTVCLYLRFTNKKYGPYLLVRLRVRSSGQNVTDPRTMHVCILAIALRSPALERAALR